MRLIDRQILELRDNFELFASSLLKVKNKSGHIVPFVMNEAQRYIHKRLEEQLATTGMVRSIILKGRQQGCSSQSFDSSRSLRGPVPWFRNPVSGSTEGQWQ